MLRRALTAGTVLAMVVGLPAALISAGAAGAATSAPVWKAASPAQLPPGDTINSSMAFDAATGQLVMFGPSVNGGECLPNVTWTWDGANWSGHQLPTAPGQRDSATMAYDAATKQVILFGGIGYDPGCHTEPANILRDTWAWNGSIWVQLHPAATPPNGGCAAYDAQTQQFIMASGTLDSTAGLTLQTWRWTGTTWLRLQPASSPPNGACSMTYDTARKVIVMIVDDANDGSLHTWTWDGASWTDAGQAPLATPLAGWAPPIVFDADTGEDIVYDGETYPCNLVGGSHSSTCTQTDETSAWNGTSWRLVASNNFPEAGSGYTMAYDDATHQIVLSEGHLYGGGPDPSTSYLYSSPGSSSVTPSRLAGADRQSTAVAVSTSAFPTAASASAVVLARADQFADALAGGPLAAAKHAPLLLTSSGSLDAATKTEIQRVLPTGGTVYLLGGTSALSAGVASAITALGDLPVRISGTDRYSTAVAIAGALGNPSTVFEASGVNFPDALSAVPAAVTTHGAILLTNGSAAVAVTKTYLAAHATTKYAIGGPAAYADPSAIGIAGADRYATSEAVALAFFPTTTGVSIASAVNYPDALAGGPVAGTANHPVLLIPPTGALPEPITAYLTTHAGELTTIQAFGGTNAIADPVLSAVADSLH